MTDVLPLLLLGYLLGRGGRGALIWWLKTTLQATEGERDQARIALHNALDRAHAAERQVTDLRAYYELDDHGDAA